MKLVQVTVGTQDGETHQIEVEEASQLAGRKIGEEFEGGLIGLEGYILEITGGSDEDGFPMRESLEGPQRRRVILSEGPGIDEEREGVRKRKSVRGNQVSENIQQLNTRVVESGSEPLEELLSEDEE